MSNSFKINQEDDCQLFGLQKLYSDPMLLTLIIYWYTDHDDYLSRRNMKRVETAKTVRRQSQNPRTSWLRKARATKNLWEVNLKLTGDGNSMRDTCANSGV